MNKINHFTQNLILSAIAVAVMALAPHAHADTVPQYITVVKVKGGARYSTDGGKSYTLLNKGDVLKPGTWIQTAEEGTVDILLGDEQAVLATPLTTASSNYKMVARDMGAKANVVHVYQNSLLSVDKLTLEKTGADEVSETQLDLKAGKIMGNVKKLSAASRYEVKIPNGVAGIRGTTFVIGADGVIYVLVGSVVISYVDKSGVLVTTTVIAGQQFDMNAPTGSPMVMPIPANAGPFDTLPQYTVPVTPLNPPDQTVIHISPN